MAVLWTSHMGMCPLLIKALVERGPCFACCLSVRDHQYQKVKSPSPENSTNTHTRNLGKMRRRRIRPLIRSVVGWGVSGHHNSRTAPASIVRVSREHRNLRTLLYRRSDSRLTLHPSRRAREAATVLPLIDVPSQSVRVQRVERERERERVNFSGQTSQAGGDKQTTKEDI
jgi:hypothetical protein